MRSMIRVHAFVSSLVISAAVLAGCGKHGQDILKEIQARNSKPVDLFTTDAVAKAAAELESKLGAPVRALDVSINNGYIYFQVQDPKKPANVDAYEFHNGVLLGPKPVQLMGGGDLEANLFELAEVPLVRIPELTKAAIAALEIEDGRVASLEIHREFSEVSPHARALMDETRRRSGLEVVKPAFADGDIKVELSVMSPRRRGFVDANAKLEIVKTGLL